MSTEYQGGLELGREGLTPVEVMAAILVLTLGLLSLSAGSGWMIRSAHATQHEHQRIFALQAMVEEVSAVPFEKLQSGRTSWGDFDISWTLLDQEVNSALVEFVAVGPRGLSRGAGGTTPFRVPADTLQYRSARR